MSYLQALGFVVAAALFWLQYFDLKDYLKPEPRHLLVGAYFLGCLSALLALLAYGALDRLLLPGYLPGVGEGLLAYCLLLVGPIEEGAKFLVARTVVFRWRQFDEPIDGLVYAAAIAIGFASVESLFYVPASSWVEAIARAVASPLTHSVFASVWGFACGIALLRTQGTLRRWLWQALPWGASALLHGFYDYALLAWGSTIVASAVILILWLGLIGYARHVVHLRGRIDAPNGV